MASDTHAPQSVRALATLGEARLREVAEHAEIALAANGGPVPLATELLSKVERAAMPHLFGLTDGELEEIGRELGLGDRGGWQPRISAEEYARLPFYQKPTYEQDVWAALMAGAVAAPKAKPAAKPKAKPAAKAKAKAKPAAKPKAKAKPRRR